ncbi:fused MFS/spermidine synthase [Anatilimnocola floriformis]|uniref:fused MFS/spermidine synthase n=1 Tax=Anatilimnocola floriformis TaxID=2948575 RepID=UPI0020C359C6|nr:fused MFS/spermidine synthase [Anatilimnocola floriformis]
MKPLVGRVLAIAIFFASGAAGMVYEISWSRQFGNVFGHTVSTGAMVLSSFLGGMAVGYWLAGKYRGRWSALSAYGLLEIVAAGWVCLVPTLLQFGARTVLGSLEIGPFGLYHVARALFCFVILLPATASLGGTWPLMAAFLTQRKERSSAWLSFGYATNTAGAMLGTVLATTFLLVTVGVTNSSYFAAAVSAGCGLLAIGLSGIADQRAVNTSSNEAGLRSTEVLLPWRWWLLAVVSGFSILALEVLYLRLFSLVFHNSTYTFGLVVTVFLFALATGSTITGFIGERLRPPQLIAWCCGIGGLGIALSIAIFTRWTQFHYFSEGDNFVAYIFSALGFVSCVVLLPVTALGMILPTTWRALEPQSLNEGQIAGLTAVSTIAGAVGSLAASFLLSVVGLWGSFALLVIMYLLIAVGMLAVRRAIWELALLGLVGFVAIEFNYSTMHETTTLEAGDKLLQRWESAYGWIDAIELSDGSRCTRQNLHYGFGNSRNSVQRDYRQGHLPLLLHGKAKDALFLGLGTGQTAAAALKHDELQSIVVVELIPEAIEAARYLKETNRGLVDDSRVEIQANDARRFLRGSGRQFDVIVSDLFVPWESHTGYLYTVEHYRAGRASLRPGGLFVQWLPMYQMGPGDFELIANSFAKVFPHTTLWWVRASANWPVLGLVGSETPIEFAETAAAKGFVEHHPHSGQQDDWLADGNSILSYYIGDWREGTELNTDEHPRVEFSAPIAHVDNRKLRGERMRSYFEDVFAKLPQNGVETGGVEGSALNRAWRLAQQRRLLGIP